MRRVEQLITQVRRATENVRVGTTDGLSDEEFIQYLNDAQELCESNIRRVYAKAFVKEKTWSATGAEQVTLPSDIWARQAVISLEWSPTGLAKDYYHLKKRTVRERFTMTGSPSQYVLYNNSILIDCYPATGTFRLIYQMKLPRLDKRRGTVASRTLTATACTALTITPSGLFVQGDYDLYPTISVVDNFGVVLMSGIAYSAVSAAGVLTLEGSSFTFASGETAPVGSYVVLGTNSSPTSSLSDECEKFLLAYCQRRILDRDSSDDRMTISEDEKAMLADIAETFAEISGDIDEIPTFNNDYFNDDDFN